MCGCLLWAPLLGTWLVTQVYALTGNQTGNPLVHRWALNPRSHTSQGWAFIFLKNENINLKSYATYVHRSIIYQGQVMEATRCPPIDEWIKTMWCWNTYTMECYSAIKTIKSCICDNTDIMLSEISQTEKDKYHIISLICRIFKKQTERYREKTDGG